MTRLLVTVGSDGFTDWVQLPNGTKLSMGPVSVLNFVTKLCPSGRQAKLVLKGFLRDQTAMVAVDEDLMWAMLAPRRARWAADSFMAQDQRTTPTAESEGKTMSNIDQDLAKIEKHVAALAKAAQAGTPREKMAEGFDILVKLASQIVPASQDGGYYGFGEPTPEPVTAPEPVAPEHAPVVDVPPVDGGLTYDVYTANNAIAEQIVTQAEETTDRIDKLADAGKKFNAARARADIHVVTSKVAGILRDTDLTAPWIADDLKRLATRGQKLHDLFAPAKV